MDFGEESPAFVTRELGLCGSGPLNPDIRGNVCQCTERDHVAAHHALQNVIFDVAGLSGNAAQHCAGDQVDDF
jgi:hypothetical protein